VTRGRRRRVAWAAAALALAVPACDGGPPDLVTCDLLDRAGVEALLGTELAFDPITPDRDVQRAVQDPDGRRTGTRTVSVDDPGRCLYTVDLGRGDLAELDVVDVTITPLGSRSFDGLTRDYLGALQRDALARDTAPPAMADLPELGDDARVVTRPLEDPRVDVLVLHAEQVVSVSVTRRGRPTAVAVARELLVRLDDRTRRT
jgi:hypothetical protein